jgi:hypothetical protein
LVCQRTASRARNSANRASDIFQKKSDQSSASQSLAIAAAKHSTNRLVGIQTKGGLANRSERFRDSVRGDCIERHQHRRTGDHERSKVDSLRASLGRTLWKNATMSPQDMPLTPQSGRMRCISSYQLAHLAVQSTVQQSIPVREAERARDLHAKRLLDAPPLSSADSSPLRLEDCGKSRRGSCQACSAWTSSGISCGARPSDKVPPLSRRLSSVFPLV